MKRHKFIINSTIDVFTKHIGKEKKEEEKKDDKEKENAEGDI